MTDLDELYQEMILDHYRHPRNRRRMDDADRQIKGDNPLCGDKFTVYLKLDGDIVKDISFDGAGCAISTASASIMTDMLKGKTLAEAKALFKKFHCLATGGTPEDEEGPELGKLKVFAGCSKYPARVKCATLAWHTFDAAADGLVVGEGAGIVVLKRLADALQQGDRIYGVIRGIGLSNDVAGSLLAPDRDGQLRAEVLGHSDLDPVKARRHGPWPNTAVADADGELGLVHLPRQRRPGHLRMDRHRAVACLPRS